MSDLLQPNLACRSRLRALRYLILVALPLATLPMHAAAAQAGTRTGRAAAQPLARATFLGTMDEEFRKSDANKDGVISRAELASHQQLAATAALEQRAREAFAAMDKDRNGQVSATEVVRANVGPAKKIDVAPMMTRLDSNRDQKVSLVEYRSLTLANSTGWTPTRTAFSRPPSNVRAVSSSKRPDQGVSYPFDEVRSNAVSLAR